ncbi:thimet oligopeptidase [Trypanosoma cruzi]|nr:thimet oligopeptidase [Trypanosoma cruzi]
MGQRGVPQLPTRTPWPPVFVWAIGMPLPGAELGTVCGQARWQDTPLGRSMQVCQQLRGEAPQGARTSGESSGSAADPILAQRETTSRPPPTQVPANNKTLSTNRTRMPALPWARTVAPIHSATVI